MPAGLPAAKPRMIPQAIGDLNALSIDALVSLTPEFAKANIGITRKLE